MIPHHLSLGQQHHLQQQQQQQADGPHLGMNSAFERQQMWIQQQQQHQQQQMLMRNQQQGGPDMASGPMQQQMADLLRSQSMNRMQSQQQPFGLGMGHPGLNHNQPSTSFLDQSNQGNPQNRMSPLGFANNMGPGGAPGQNTSNFNGAMNRNMMLQALQNNQSHNRQLELMGLAQNQQNQNSPLNLPNRLVAGGMPPHQAPGGGFNGPPGMNQGVPQQGDLFPNGGPGSNEAMRRPSPSHLPQQHQPQPPVGPTGRPTGPSPPGQMGIPNGPRRIITLSDLQERSQFMGQNIQSIEFQMRNLASARATMTDQIFTQKMRTLQLEITQRKEGLTKINQLMNQMTTSGKTTMTLPLPQSAPGPSWMANQSMPGSSLQQPPFGGNGNMSGPIGQPSLQTNGQPSPSPAHASPSSLGTPRSGPPANAPPFPNQVPPNMNFPQANSQGSPSASGANGLGNNANGGAIGNSVPQGLPFNLLGPIPPLAKERFGSSYKNFCAQKNITHEQRLLSIDNLTIDLYALHVEVMKEGGANLVQQKDLWPIIAGRLGCVQFPGEPPKSGPAAANQLAHVYREYLMEFDRIYMASFADQRRKTFAQQMVQNPIFTKFTAPQIKTLVEFSNKSVPEMRMANMPEELIRAVEGHRQHLQVLAREQNLFRTMLTMKSGQQGNGGMPMVPPDGGMSVKPPFSGSPQPSNINGVMPPGPPFIPGNTAPLGPHPTPSQQGLQQALLDVHTMRQDYLQRCIPNLQTVDVPAEQRLEYNSLLEQVHSRATAMEQKLSYLHLVGKSEQNTRLVISKVINVQHQRTMIGYSNPRFIMTLDDLRKANQVIQTALDFVSNAFKQQTGGIPPNSAPPSTQIRQTPNPTAHQHPSPQAHQSSPLANPVLNRPVNLQQLPAPIKRAPSKGSASSPKDISTPPPANASTPNAPTPTHNVGSPQTPKSPKTKAPAKPRQQQQKRRLSSVSKHPSTPTTEPAQIPAPTNGVKRPREEEEPSPPNVGGSSSTPTVPGPPGATNEPSPPKRVKTDWEGSISDELKKKTEAVENIKTEEEASSFLEQMFSSVSNIADGTAGGLPAEFCQTLDAIFKGVSTIPDSEGSGDVSSILGGDIIGRSSPSPVKDEFVEFFDFSSFGAAQEGDESDSKADTPDLIPSSSTNPSPESNHESDPTLHVLNDMKSEEISDPLRLGTLKEIDGGESAYYQSHEWKWESSMATLDQPWAMLHNSE
ncbi:hypothetical protein VNI00_005214 [Paramarasmius palmivorus]|uniref:ARID domain-containing protein n=1 Tax=Paramarasmius palmivorus TaxID=297713 RepID=A0AAW0DLF8_9AGAR